MPAPNRRDRGLEHKIGADTDEIIERFVIAVVCGVSLFGIDEIILFKSTMCHRFGELVDMGKREIETNE